MASEPPEVLLRREVPRYLVDEQVRSGAWLRLRRGAYTATPGGEPWEQRRTGALARAVAVQRQLERSVLSHESAALAHDLPVWRTPSTTSVIQPVKPRAGLPTDVRRRRCALAPEDVVAVGDLRVTAIERTIVDCALDLHPRDALVIADGGMRAILRPHREDPRSEVLARADELRLALLGRIARGYRGAVQARAVLEIASPLAESAPESVLRWIALSNGLPAPELQRRIETARGTFWSDVAWPSDRDGSSPWHHVEFDGVGKYSQDREGTATANTLLRERRRESAITDTGDRVLRIYPDEITSERAVLAKLTGALPRAITSGCTPIAALRGRPSR